MNRHQRFRQRMKLRRAGVPIPPELMPMPRLGRPRTSDTAHAKRQRAYWARKRRNPEKDRPKAKETR